MPPETDNMELEELFRQDQRDRQKVYNDSKALDVLRLNDRVRSKRVYEMIQAGEVQTRVDLYHAAIILHHGDRSEDFLVAHRLASLSAVMGHRTARWLMAASLDRALMAMDRPQVYGTQFEFDGHSRRYELKLPIEDAFLLNFEKKFLGVPAIPERLADLNSHLNEEKKV